ncbi:MAG TPA: GMC oxidoreductase, partial [Burkholderiaceae bacterium]|nr:GMC oxidoreductase [Burkholderiaceae bacterium]
EELEPSHDDAITDQALEDYVRWRAKTVYHPVGTCKMGVDSESVVDPQLRVRGVARLRVCDASVFPTIMSGNTNAPVIMVAERCGDFILSGSR